MRIRLLLLLLCLFTQLSAKTRTALWEGTSMQRPGRAGLTVFPADSAARNGAAVLICPGGSYHHLGMPHEGYRTAEWFQRHGVTAFVLRYRVSKNGYHHPSMLEDFQQSMRYIRNHAEAYGIDTAQVGAIGFSAGGHLVLMGAALYREDHLSEHGVRPDRSVRPDWVAAIYPVVSMQDSIAHRKSRRSLLGPHPDQAQKDRLSMEMVLPDDMPPVYLQASADDPVVDYRNSLVLDRVLTARHLPHLFATYPTGGHGYGMKDTPFTRSSGWQERLWSWLVATGMGR